MYDVVIIGCGIVGAAAAFELSRYNLKTVVLERENDVACGTTKANSAILHAGYDPLPGTLMAKLNVEGARLAKELCAKLDVPYRQCGSFVLALTPEELPALEALYQRGVENGVPGLELLSAAHALEMEPNLAPTLAGALWAPSAAIVSPWEYTLALAETAVKNGVQLHLNSPVTAITPIEGGYHVQAGKEKYEARFILNAAGVHADAVHNLAAAPAFRILPDRGGYYLLDKSEGTFVSRVIFQCPTAAGKGTLIAPTVHGNLIVGPNNELNVDCDDLSTTGEGLAEVAKMARRSAPEINLRQSIRNFAGVRAAADKEDFIIAPVEGAPGMIDLAGIKSPGLTAAPAIAKMAVELLRDGGLTMVEKSDFTAERSRIHFEGLSQEEKTALIQCNPAYGQVICRCETVTEGEILDALHGPIPPVSLDGVKRRVGAGMGRCQGGFCSPRVLELLSRELGIPHEAVMQDGVGSVILTGETKGGCAK